MGCVGSLVHNEQIQRIEQQQEEERQSESEGESVAQASLSSAALLPKRPSKPLLAWALLLLLR